MFDFRNFLHRLFVGCLIGFAPLGYSQSDTLATPETSNLLASLKTMSERKVLFGHQHTTAYGVYWEDDNLRSDVNDVTGAFPAVYGWGFWHTGTAFKGALEYDYLAQLMREAYERGGVNTMAWHMENPVTGGEAWDNSIPMASILPGGADHSALVAKLDIFADFMLNLTDASGTPIPVIFRPFHESNGSWFWWGAATLTDAEFIALWQFTVGYLRDTRGVHNLLYAYSPDNCNGSEATYLARYAGDAYVDILGKDHYFSGAPGAPYWQSVASLIDDLTIIGNLAVEKGKVAALTEFGYSDSSGVGLSYSSDVTWFMDRFLSPVSSDSVARRISYCMAWRNANDLEYSGHYFVPYPGHQNEADFKRFKDDPYTVFNDTLPNMYGVLHTAIYSAGTWGTVTGNPLQFIEDGADGSLVTAVPDTGYRFLGWSDGNSSAMRTDTTVGASISVTANFVLNTPPLIVSTPWADTNPVMLPGTTSVNVVANDTNNDALTYTWAKVTGLGLASFEPNGTGASNTATASFDTAGDYLVEVTVSDGSASVSRNLFITVLPANVSPMANAGADQAVTDSGGTGSVSLTLDGSASSDTDGTIVSYSWTQSGLQIATGAKPVVSLTPGIYTITLMVTDNVGDSDTDTVAVKVNTPPEARDSSISTMANTSAELVLDAGDADGNVLSYRIVENPAHGVLLGTAPNLVYEPVTGYVGADSFTFTVNDGLVESSPATVSVTVTGGGGRSGGGCRLGSATPGSVLPLLLILAFMVLFGRGEERGKP